MIIDHMTVTYSQYSCFGVIRFVTNSTVINFLSNVSSSLASYLGLFPYILLYYQMGLLHQFKECRYSNFFFLVIGTMIILRGLMDMVSLPHPPSIAFEMIWRSFDIISSMANRSSTRTDHSRRERVSHWGQPFPGLNLTSPCLRSLYILFFLSRCLWLLQREMLAMLC